MGQAHSLLAKSSVSGVWGVELARRHSDDTAGFSSSGRPIFLPDTGIAFPSLLQQELKQESLPVSTLLCAVGWVNHPEVLSSFLKALSLALLLGVFGPV